MHNLVVKERPILFSGAMVRALLAGSKTQTRRELKHDCSAELMADPRVKVSYTTSPLMAHFKIEDEQPREFFCGLKCPYGQPGDRLWVRETVAETIGGQTVYRADASDEVAREVKAFTGWTPSIFMPRWASRLLLEVTAVRCERLQDISEADAVAEGVEFELVKGKQEWFNYLDEWAFEYFAKDSYATLWEKINGLQSWAANPWVWVVEFKVIDGKEVASA